MRGHRSQSRRPSGWRAVRRLRRARTPPCESRLRRSERRRVLGLIEPQLAAPREPDRRHEAKSGVLDRPEELGSAGTQIRDSSVDVVAHEIELVPSTLIGRMGGQLGGGQREDEPAAAGVYVRELENVLEECAIRVRVRREEHCMQPGDHLRTPRKASSVAPAKAASSRMFSSSSSVKSPPSDLSESCRRPYARPPPPYTATASQPRIGGWSAAWSPNPLQAG